MDFTMKDHTLIHWQSDDEDEEDDESEVSEELED